MDHRVDLDEMASRLGRLVPVWRRLARVSAFTWRDEEAAWPQPITSDRAEIIVPESLGVRLLRDPADEAEIVVWTGGWADIGLLVDGEVLDLCPEFSDVDGAYAVVVENIEDFLA